MPNESLKKIIKESSPWGKMLTGQSVFKAWASSMAVGLFSIGISKEEIKEIISEAKYGFDSKYIDNLLNSLDGFIKIQDQDQTSQPLSLEQ